ncbi:hypothetical protein [Phenylobacterium sp.]|jgi:hypothetical protein|uniref:hypothetical protein n=1 Tax=Phenylobacterium sp. TaxID=1871053 RepID=UPI002F95F642
MAPVVALALAGCATAYKVSDAGGPQAQVVFVEAVEKAGLGEATLQTLFVSETQACEDARRAFGLSWIDPNSKTTRVPAERPVTLFAESTYLTLRINAGLIQSVPLGCYASATFTPRAGRRYRVEHRAPRSLTRCQLVVVDEATGARPADLRIDPAATCRKARTWNRS